jgi:hypothetical protein
MVLMQSMGAEVVMTELVGRKTVPELVKERDKRNKSRKRRGAVIVDINSRRA